MTPKPFDSGIVDHVEPPSCRFAALAGAQPLALLAARLYMAQVFFQSGLTRLRDRDTTLALFMDEYQVPLLSPVAPAALQQHILWGFLLIGVLLWGPGRWALDRFVPAWLQQRTRGPGYTRAA